MEYQSSTPTSIPHEELLCKACWTMRHTILSGSLQTGRMEKWFNIRNRVVSRIGWNYNPFSNVFFFFLSLHNCFLKKEQTFVSEMIVQTPEASPFHNLHSPTLRTVMGRSPRILVPIGKFLEANGVDSSVIHTGILLPSRKLSLSCDYQMSPNPS